MKKDKVYSKLTLTPYRIDQSDLLSWIVGHVNGGGHASVLFSKKYANYNFYIDEVRKRKYFERTNMIIIDHNDELIKVFFFRSDSIHRVTNEISNNIENEIQV